MSTQLHFSVIALNEQTLTGKKKTNSFRISPSLDYYMELTHRSQCIVISMFYVIKYCEITKSIGIETDQTLFLTQSVLTLCSFSLLLSSRRVDSYPNEISNWNRWKKSFTHFLCSAFMNWIYCGRCLTTNPDQLSIRLWFRQTVFCTCSLDGRRSLSYSRSFLALSLCLSARSLSCLSRLLEWGLHFMPKTGEKNQ